MLWHPFRSRQERPIHQVPRVLQALLGGILLLQLAWHQFQPTPTARATSLPATPAMAVLRLAALGEPVALAKGLDLWLQSFDNQPGISIPFRQLNYPRLRGWLDHILQLDPRGHYPLLAAARLYGEVPDPLRQRLMLDFIYKKFLEAPGERWPWMAHAVLVARHRLKDLPLALKYARAITDNTTEAQAPHWARQLQIFVLEGMGEKRAATILLGGLLNSGQITDANELHFLKERLQQLKGEQGVLSKIQ